MSVHNVLNAPSYVFDSVSQAIASLLGLATPLTGDGSNLVGMWWGRILLVVLLVLAVWRLRRSGPPDRDLWTVLGIGGGFWVLLAVNAIGTLRLPSDGRYQYPAAVFVLLIVAELLRGARAGKRAMAAMAVVTAGAVASGLVFLRDGYELQKTETDLVKARLAAVEIARHRTPSTYVVNLDFVTSVDAGAYFSAIDAFGSPADTQSELSSSPPTDRAAADQVLASALGIRLTSDERADGQSGGGEGCRRARASAGGRSGLALGPGRYTLQVRSAPSATMTLARFGDAPTVNLGVVQSGSPRSLDIPADLSSRPWRLVPQGSHSVIVCDIASPRS